MKSQLSSLLLTVAFMFGLNYADFKKSEVRSLESYNSIDVSGGIKLYMQNGNKHEAEVEVENADLDDLVTKVVNNQLQVHFKRSIMNVWKNNRSATVTVTYKNLNQLEIESGCYVESLSTISANDFDLSCKSGTRVILELEADDLDIDMSSGTSLSLEGEVNNLSIDASSGSAFDGSELKAQSVDVEASSGTSIKVWAIQSLIAEAKSGSSIRYKGSPSVTDNSSKYAGSVSRIR